MNTAFCSPVRPTSPTGFLVGLYVATGLILHFAATTPLDPQVEPAARGVLFFLWVGLGLGQLCGGQMWVVASPSGRLLAGALGLGLAWLASPIFSRVLGGPADQWWLGLICLLLASHLAWLGLFRSEHRKWRNLIFLPNSPDSPMTRSGSPLPVPQTGREPAERAGHGTYGPVDRGEGGPVELRPARDPIHQGRTVGGTRYSLGHWLVLCLWLAAGCAVLQGGLQDSPTRPSWLAATVVCFGGLGLLVAIQRFALRQLFWPHPGCWPGPQAAWPQRTLDAAGILLILLAIHGLVSWGLYSLDGQLLQAAPALWVIWAACAWQVCDLWFERLIQSQSPPLPALE